MMKKIFFSLVTIILFSCSSGAQTQEKSRPVKVNGVISVAADLVLANAGCYTVNVRVYLTYEGETLLLANSNVQVGDCQKKSGNNENPNCTDQYFKGDYFFYSKDQFKYCIVDLLQDEVTYAKYVIAKSKVIESVKK